MMKLSRTSMLLSLILIFVLGLVLRLFQLGTDEFWVDELGVAQAAFADNPSQAVAVARSHVMAMPMDYVVTWLMGRASATAGWLRLPAALWGAFTLPAAFLLYCQAMNRRSAMWGVFLLAISPMLIKYSQELRFYAPLVFFYTFATALGFRAIRLGRFKDWLMFVAVAVTGIFFHLYASFALVNVIAFSTMKHQHQHGRFPLRALAISFFAIFTAALIAVSQFGSLAGEHAPLFFYETPVNVILGGLGFLPPFPAEWMAYLLGGLLLVLTLIGLLQAGTWRPLILAIALQIGIILALDFWQGYFASARQLLPILPLTGFFTVRGLILFLAWVKKPSPAIRRVAAVIILLGISSLVLVPYYQAEKTSTRPILQILDATWKPAESILVIPPYNATVYAYYAPQLANDLVLSGHDAAFIIADPDFDPGLGFERLYEPAKSTLYPQALWRKH